jgi:hypothetical protein
MSRFRLSLGLCVGFGLLLLARDRATAGEQQSATKRAEKSETSLSKPTEKVRWKAAENRTWRWYQRENLVRDQWRVTAITTPVNKATGQRYTGETGYIEESAVPIDVRRRGHKDDPAMTRDQGDEPGRADAARRENGGRPPSQWLRSLNTQQLREWLKTIDVPEAGVEGMTYAEHLTRDHSFDAETVAGLTEEEQAKLHAAAHHGY